MAARGGDVGLPAAPDLSMRRAGRVVYRTRRDLQERLAAFTAHAQEVLSLSGIMLVKSFGREATERERSYGLADELRRVTSAPE